MPSKGAIQLDCEIPYSEASLPLWRELLWGVEWLDLRSSPVYRGVGIPRGHGEPVILVPGFLGTDGHLTELQRWLTRSGYRTVLSGLGRNADCPDVMMEMLMETVQATYETTGQRVRLIGHSLGGTLARASAILRPELIAQVITLGSPIREVRAHPLVLSLARLVGSSVPKPSEAPRRHGDHFHDGTCSCEMIDALASPFPPEVARAAIFTRRDGVVDWRSCVEDDRSVDVEVAGSHLGLVVNKEAYLAIARLLAGLGRRISAVAA